MALLSPLGPQFFNNDGTVAAGCFLYTTLSGTTTARATYTNQAGTVAHANPIVLDSAGKAQPHIWLAPGVEYRFRLETAAGALIDEWDDIAGIPNQLAIYQADDFATLQAAVDGAANAALMLSSSTNYSLSSAVTISSPIVIYGYGAKISTGASHITALRVTSSDVTILGAEIEGAGNGSYNTNGRLIDIQGTEGGAGVAPTRISRITIRDCNLYSAGRSAVRAQYAENLSILDNRIRDVAYAGVEILSCNDFDVRGNDIVDVTPGTSGNMYGVYVSQTNDADTVRYPVCNQGSVTHNHIENVEWEGIDCHGGNELDFSHNRLINCGDTNAAIAIIHADDATSTPIVPAKNVRVGFNVITGAQQYGIATSTGSSTVIHQNLTIVGNVLENCGLVSTSNDYGGIRIGSARNWVVADNSLNFCAPYGVIVNDQYAANGTIQNNTFYRIVSNTDTTPSAILIDRGASGTGPILIGGNTIRLSATGETYEAINGVRVVSTDGGNIRFGVNHFDAAGTKYSITSTQWAGGSFPVVNAGSDSIAVTTGVSTANKVVTLPIGHSANTVYVPTAVLFSTPAGNERSVIHCTRTSATSITVTVYSAGGANFAAAGNMSFFWETKGV
jgi:Right handed beta helix region